MKKLLCVLLAMMLMLSCVTVVSAEEVEPLKVAINSQFTTLDPGLNTEVVNNYAINHMYAGMFVLDENNMLVNELCESYTVSEDGLVYTFNMVKDATWSDGVAITANDFVYSYLRALSYGADNVWAVNDFVNFVAGAAEYNAKALEVGESFDCTVEDASSVGIKALDDYTLEITLFTPCAYLCKLMASNVWLPVREDFAPQHESLWSFEVGYPVSGAYQLDWVSENEGAGLVKNEAYFKADTVACQAVEMTVMTDTSAMSMAFQTGEIDLAINVSSETALQYESEGNLWLMPSPSNYFLAINSGSTGPDWAKDVNVRRALALAIDKSALVEVLGGETLYPVLNGYIPTGIGGVSGDFREEGDADGYTLTYDPDQAKALLAEAGYTEDNPLVINYKYSNNGVHGDVALVLQGMWKAIGVECNLVAVESGVFYDQLDQGDFEISRYGYVANTDPMQYLVLWTTGIQVVAAVDDPAYDEMVANAAKLTDATEYYTELHAIEDYLVEENVYCIPLFNYTTPCLVATGLTGYTQHGGSIYFGDCVME